MLLRAGTVGLRYLADGYQRGSWSRGEGKRLMPCNYGSMGYLRGYKGRVCQQETLCLECRAVRINTQSVPEVSAKRAIEELDACAVKEGRMKSA